MSPLRTNYSDGGATPEPGNVTAADMNAIAGDVNANAGSLSAINSVTGLVKGTGTALEAAVSGVDYARAFWVNVLDHGADPTGVADSTAAFTAAIAALPASGGWAYAPAGAYKVSSTLDFNAFQSLRGDGKAVTIINYTGSGPCINAGASQGSPTGAPTPCGFESFTIDGTNAQTGAVGLQIGNLFDAYARNLGIQNFKTTGAIGLFFANYGSLPVTNRLVFQNIYLINNSTAVVFDGANVLQQPQWAYCIFDFYIEGGANQCGVTLQNSAVVSGCPLFSIRGNFSSNSTTNTGWVIGIDPTSTSTYSCGLNFSEIFVMVESDAPEGTTGPTPIVMGTNVANSFSNRGWLQIGGTGNLQNTSIPYNQFFYMAGTVVVPGLTAAYTEPGDVAVFMGGVQRNCLTLSSGYVSTNKTALQIPVNRCEVLEINLINGPVVVSGFTDVPEPLSRQIDIILSQPASGAAGTITWPANVQWSGGNSALSTANNAVDRVRLVYHPAADVWYGDVVTDYTATALNATRLFGGTYWTSLAANSAATATQQLTLPAATTDTLVSRTSADTLTNKTVSGASNTLTNIPMSATPAVANAVFTPTDYNWIAWSSDPYLAYGNVAPAAGYASYTCIPIRASATVTNIIMDVVIAGATLASGECFAALFQYTGGGYATMLATTADQSTNWTSTGLKTMALSTPQNVTPGLYYIGYLWNGTTGPKFSYSQAGSASDGANANFPRFAIDVGHPASTAFSSPAALTVAATGNWVAVS